MPIWLKKEEYNKDKGFIRFFSPYIKSAKNNNVWQYWSRKTQISPIQKPNFDRGCRHW